MSALISDLSRPIAAAQHAAAGSDQPLIDLILVRLAARGGATRAETIRDLSFFVQHRLSPGEWRRAAEAALGALTARDLAEERRGRFRVTERGADEEGEQEPAREPGAIGPHGRPPISSQAWS